MSGSSSALMLIVLLCGSCAMAALAMFVMYQNGMFDGLGPGGGTGAGKLPGAGTVEVDDTTVKDLAARLSTDPGDYLAHITDKDGNWTSEDFDWWTAGYMTGCWRRMAQLTNDPKWTKLADDATQKLAPWQNHTTSHNIGIVIMQTAPSASALKTAAATMAKRWQPALDLFKSRDSKNDPLTVTIDNMMSLKLMFEAAKAPGGTKEWATMAEKHALRTAELFVRSDGSTVHWCQFPDPQNRDKVIKKTNQGFSDTSCWARGHSWAIYGFTDSYEYTKNPKLLEAAKKVTKYYLDNVPDDGVPWWDFNAPSNKRYRETSAAAVTACGLFKLARATGNSAYRDDANAIVASLLKNYRGKGKSLLCCSNVNVAKNIGVNVGYTCTDSHLLEALVLARQAS